MDIVSRVSELLTNEGIEEKRIVYIETQLRHEYSGSYTYVTKKSPATNQKIIEQAKLSRDFPSIARKFNVSVRTVYRLYRESRKTA